MYEIPFAFEIIRRSISKIFMQEKLANFLFTVETCSKLFMKCCSLPRCHSEKHH